MGRATGPAAGRGLALVAAAVAAEHTAAGREAPLARNRAAVAAPDMAAGVGSRAAEDPGSPAAAEAAVVAVRAAPVY